MEAEARIPVGIGAALLVIVVTVAFVVMELTMLRQVQPVEPGAGSPAYSEGSGVVLDVLHPHHEATGSALIVRGVFWNERVRRQVLAGSSDTSFSIEIREERQVVANVYFQRLPSAMHTYMLTIGA